MELNVSASENINGTLVLPLYQGSESVPESCEVGMPASLKSQINRVLSDGDFKAKKKTTMTLFGGEDGKAILVGLGKNDDCTTHDFRKAGAAVTAAEFSVLNLPGTSERTEALSNSIPFSAA